MPRGSDADAVRDADLARVLRERRGEDAVPEAEVRAAIVVDLHRDRAIFYVGVEQRPSRDPRFGRPRGRIRTAAQDRHVEPW